jgi:hypothetical protein
MVWGWVVIGRASFFIVLESVVHAVLNSVRHDVRKYVARIRPVAVHISGRP